MQTKRSKVTEKDVERWCKLWLKLQKDGIYKPWLEVREVPSLGRSRKVKGIKTHHTHHFLSDIEYHIYLMLEYNPAVIAIYEQYPLLPREDSIEIANEMGIRHPVYPQSKTPIVLTTDVVFDYTHESGEIKRGAISVKPESELDVGKKSTKRTLHKMELEKLIHAKNGIKLSCVTEKNINKKTIYNLKWFVQDAVISDELTKVNNEWLSCFISVLEKIREDRLNNILESISVMMNIDKEESTRLYRHNMWHQTLKTDISNKIELTSNIKLEDYQSSILAIEDMT